MNSVHYVRGSCNDLAISESLEWLVTNGIGGYASGTVANLLTRRYHGLLVAALKPPLGRVLMISKFDDTVECDGRVYPIYSNRWADVLVEPNGYRHIENFTKEGTVPVWTYSFGSSQLEKRIWMQPGKNTTYVNYKVTRAFSPMTLVIRAMVNYRDIHGETHSGDWQMQVRRVPRGIKVVAFEGAVPFYIFNDREAITLEHHWYRNFSLNMEPYHGAPAMEDHLNIGAFRVTLQPGESVTFVLSTELTENLNGETALAERRDYEEKLLALAPGLPPALVLAADQFVVKRGAAPDAESWSILAGYHWLQDWSRDTLISLPGILLATGRFAIAKNILLNFSQYVSEGMLPNHLPQGDETPLYQSVDVTLWYFEAVKAYFTATADIDLLRELFPLLAEIVAWFERGTRFQIHIDPLDGLLFAGEIGIPLTWMDSKSGNWGVTPRTGKPVEINALWYNALRTMAEFAKELGLPAEHYSAQAKQVRTGFSRFWNAKTGYCFDVIDTPTGDDPSLRPNQLLAVSLSHSLLKKEQQKAVLDICIRRLLTPFGLRSLSPDDPGFIAHYNGDTYHPDSAYHQGTVWAWLIGPFISAYLKLYKDPAGARSFLEPLMDHLYSRGVGSISEIFDGDAPYTPRGCIAQAWSVAELLRVWREIDATKPNPHGI